MVLNYNDNVKVLSLPADKMASSGRIFWYVRAVDTKGTGRATVRLKDVAKYFDVFVPTIYRWLKDAKERGYLHDYTLHRNGNVTVVYVTYKRFLEKFNLESLGQVVWCNRAQMRNLKPTVTIAELQTKQNQSLYMSQKANKANVGRSDAQWRNLSYEERVRLDLMGEVRTIWRSPNAIFEAEKQKKKKKKKKQQLLNPSIKPILKNKPTVDTPGKAEAELLSPKRTKRRIKVILNVGSRFAIVTNKMIPIGTSQTTLATSMRRSVSTIQRRTKAIERKQILTILPIDPATGEYMSRENTKILIHDGIVYEACPNIYKFGGKYETSSAQSYTKRAKSYQHNKKQITA